MEMNDHVLFVMKNCLNICALGLLQMKWSGQCYTAMLFNSYNPLKNCEIEKMPQDNFHWQGAEISLVLIKNSSLMMKVFIGFAIIDCDKIEGFDSNVILVINKCCLTSRFDVSIAGCFENNPSEYIVEIFLNCQSHIFSLQQNDEGKCYFCIPALRQFWGEGKGTGVALCTDHSPPHHRAEVSNQLESWEHSSPHPAESLQCSPLPQLQLLQVTAHH